MSDRLRIGVLSLVMPRWSAGTTFTRVVLEALARSRDPAREEICLIARADATLAGTRVALTPVDDADYSLKSKLRRRALDVRDRLPSLPGEWAWRRRLHLADTSNPFHVARLAGVSVVLPVLSVVSPGIDVRRIGWIPDFQHRFLPQFFSEAERAERTEANRRLAERSARIMLSSRAVEAHFAEAYPEHIHKVRVLPFPSLFAFDPPRGDPREAVARYDIPEKFALVTNQLWAHKNHTLVLDALAIAKDRGLRVPVVMTGTPGDHRDPGNRALSALLQRIATAGLSGQVRVLGEVPYADLLGLLRSAAVLLQPSRFEGWNTGVQDALALGRPVACSDIAVHREQAPGALGFFGCDDPGALADLLLARWEGLSPGPDPAREEAALAAARVFARGYGEQLVRLCREAA